jgi:hypothetical protein
MSTETRPQHASKGSNLGSAITSAGSVTRERSRARTTEIREPSMHAMRRILGDEVLDLFPDGIVETCDELFKLHKEDTDQWAEVRFDSAADRNDALALMRAYAECADDPGYTIRQDKATDPDVLRFRVTVRKGSGSEE